jgi:hypothetical protein
MRLPRMTTRRWMVAVAVLAVGIAGYDEITRCIRSRDYYLFRASTHTIRAELHRGMPTDAERRLIMLKKNAAPFREGSEGRAYWLKQVASWERRCDGHRRQADYHGALAHKYAHAATRPWWTVAPDPPEPVEERRF